jgi:hypothetical protein
VQEVTGFQSKREAAAEKVQEPVNLLEARRIADEYGTPDSQVDSGNLYFALRKCLEHIDAQPAQEPFGYFKAEPFGWTDCAETDEGAKALYEAPPKREWVGLTDEEHCDIWYKESLDWMEYGKAIEAKLKEKNG